MSSGEQKSKQKTQNQQLREETVSPQKILQNQTQKSVEDKSRSLNAIDIEKFIINQIQLNTMLKELLLQQKRLNFKIPTQIKSETQQQQNNNKVIIRKDTSNEPIRLSISNQESKYRLKSGFHFKDLLEPRDVVLQHSFNFEVNADIEDLKDILKSKAYKDILKNIKQFLVQTLANILSVSINFLNENKLEEKEAKNYAASNIMLNVTSIYTKTINELKRLTQFALDKIDFEEIQTDLVMEIQKIMRDILINLADCYPQAPITGGTLRMKNVINEVNRTDDEENDLIFSNDIRIDKYLKFTETKDEAKRQYQQIQLQDNGDYKAFIMQVVNTAINVVQTSQNDSRQRSNKQIFTQFCRQLFALSENQSYRSLINLATTEYSQKTKQNQQPVKQEKNEKASSQDKQAEATEAICSFFQRLTETDDQNLIKIKQKIKQYGFTSEQPKDNSSFKDYCSHINGTRQKMFDSLKGYAISSKIPSHVKMFSKHQIQDKKFKVQHSSILRIMTKWAEYLQEIFDDPEKHVLMRQYSFKDFHNKIINLNQMDALEHFPDKISNYNKQGNKIILVENLKKQQKLVNQKLCKIKFKVIEMIGDTFSRESESFVDNVYRFSNTRKTTSKINAILTTLMVDYLSVLIHHLIKAGQVFVQYNNNPKSIYIADVNLLVFKVSDLMRAKFKCSEGSFVTLLKTMYILDEKKEMNNKFRLVRIKNKLQDKANNIMINFLFMGKVTCQLQLSVQESKGKQKNYFTFSHLVYQMTRGKFGIISECSIMISQLDPMISSCDKPYYAEKKQKDNQIQVKKQKQKEIFYCKNENCKQLSINESRSLFPNQQQTCLKCIYNKYDNERLIYNNQQTISKELINYLKDEKIARMKKYGVIQLNEGHQYYLRLDSSGKLQLMILVCVRKELKHFIVKVNKQIVSSIKNNKSINYSQQVEYINVSNLIKDNTQINDHFLFKVTKNTIINQLSNLLNLEDLTQTRLEKLVTNFIEFRKQKSMIKSIKFKAEIINCDFDKEKWQSFKNIINIYSINSKSKRQQKIQKQLKYKKYNCLQFGKIKTVQVVGCDMPKIFEALYQKCTNINEIIFRKNSLSHVNQLSILSKLDKLDLSNNRLKNVYGLKNLKTINTLILSNNLLKNVNDLEGLKTINKLQIRSCSLQDVHGLKGITTIDQLDISQNQLQNVDGLQNLQTVNKLLLNQNELENIDGLQGLRTINKLDLGFNQLQHIDRINDVTSIKKIQLRQNPSLLISVLPPSLEQLCAYNTQLIEFDFKKLPKLLQLNTNSLNRSEFLNLPQSVKIYHNSPLDMI